VFVASVHSNAMCDAGLDVFILCIGPFVQLLFLLEGTRSFQVSFRCPEYPTWKRLPIESPIITGGLEVPKASPRIFAYIELFFKSKIFISLPVPVHPLAPWQRCQY
jgi:hypothetical protein